MYSQSHNEIRKKLQLTLWIFYQSLWAIRILWKWKKTVRKLGSFSVPFNTLRLKWELRSNLLLWNKFQINHVFPHKYSRQHISMPNEIYSVNNLYILLCNTDKIETRKNCVKNFFTWLYSLCSYFWHQNYNE